MQLHGHVSKLLSQPANDAKSDDASLDIEDKALDAALRVATIIRDYRETYGFHITGAIMWQAALYAIYTLFRHMTSKPHEEGSRKFRVRDINAGFTECFRCLLAAGIGIMLPRAISCMNLSTAHHIGSEIPGEVKEMLAVVAGNAWKPSDARHVQSSIPNWALARHGNYTPAEYGMEAFLQETEASKLSAKSTQD